MRLDEYDNTAAAVNRDSQQRVGLVASKAKQLARVLLGLDAVDLVKVSAFPAPVVSVSTQDRPMDIRKKGKIKQAVLTGNLNHLKLTLGPSLQLETADYLLGRKARESELTEVRKRIALYKEALDTVQWFCRRIVYSALFDTHLKEQGRSAWAEQHKKVTEIYNSRELYPYTQSLCGDHKGLYEFYKDLYRASVKKALEQKSATSLPKINLLPSTQQNELREILRHRLSQSAQPKINPSTYYQAASLFEDEKATTPNTANEDMSQPLIQNQEEDIDPFTTLIEELIQKVVTCADWEDAVNILVMLLLIDTGKGVALGKAEEEAVAGYQERRKTVSQEHANFLTQQEFLQEMVNNASETELDNLTFDAPDGYPAGQGLTLLHLAIQAWKTADPDAKDNASNMVLYLIEKWGMSPYVKNQKGQTAFEYASIPLREVPNSWQHAIMRTTLATTPETSQALIEAQGKFNTITHWFWGLGPLLWIRYGTSDPNTLYCQIANAITQIQYVRTRNQALAPPPSQNRLMPPPKQPIKLLELCEFKNEFTT